MSLKDDIKSVKQELNTEEQFLEGFVKFERFFKKNKIVILAAVGVIIVGFIAMTTTDYLREENKKEANIAFNQVLENPNNQQAIATLKEKNMRLYEIALYLQAQKENKIADVNVEFLKEISYYHKALKEQSLEKLNTVSMQNNFLLKEFAIFNQALILTEKGQYKDAQEKLRLIPQESKVNDLVQILNHFLLTKV